ncbi:MAG: hypothetical protein SOZ48_02260 [Eubacterium sp.]|nr:hypothetical protein [Eubacterium sp.]
MEELKRKLVEISNYFYQERNQEGMNLFMETVGMVAQMSSMTEYIEPLFDALENDDYILAADILYHEVVMKM